MLGAAGVLMGTRFYASQEAAAAPGAKERIRKATGDETLRSIVFDISRRNVWPAPFTARCLRNAHADRWFGLEIELMRHLDEESAKYAAARDAGDFDIAAVIAGEAVGLIHDIPSANDVIERVVHEALALLTQWSPQDIDFTSKRTLCWQAAKRNRGESFADFTRRHGVKELQQLLSE